MEIKNKIAALTILTAFNFVNVQAAAIDTELAVIAAEQADDDSQEKKSEPSSNVTQEKKSRKELKAEEKRLKEERKAAEKQRKEEMKAAEKEVREAQKNSKDQNYRQLKNSERNTSKENFPAVDPVTTPVEVVPIERNKKDTEVTTFEPPANSTSQTHAQTQSPPQQVQTPSQQTQTPPQQVQTPPQQNSTPAESPQQNPAPAVGLPNPITMQATFDDLVKAANFVPLYVPKKSGFSINSLMLIDGRTAEIRYGRRWEPEVSLNVRTYKRLDGEETKDISGVYGVKWRVDMTSGITIYIAKIEENKHVAAWAVGNYTFSAQAENLSFAAFHSLVADELVDLSRHYYIK